MRAAGMFRKARRVNVRKRNDSEEEERERDEEQEPPPLLPPPGTGEEPGPGGGDRAPGGESLLGPGLPPPAALTSGPGIEAGGCFPGGAEPGNGLKPRKRPRENKEVPRASLLSFQDEDEGNRRASTSQIPTFLPCASTSSPRIPWTPSLSPRERSPFPPDPLHSVPASGHLLWLGTCSRAATSLFLTTASSSSSSRASSIPGSQISHSEFFK